MIPTEPKPAAIQPAAPQWKQAQRQMFDMFLHIDGVQGESRDVQYPNEMQIISFMFKEKQTGTFHQDGGGGAGKAWLGDFEVTLRASRAGPKLFEACTTGRHIERAWVACRKAGNWEEKRDHYIRWVFENLLVSSYELVADVYEGLLPLEKVTLNFQKVFYEYKLQADIGTMEGTVAWGTDTKAQRDWNPQMPPSAGAKAGPPRKAVR